MHQGGAEALTELAETYADGGFLDAKWDVLRRHRTASQSFEDWLVDQLPLRPGVRVLDAGAGSGRFALPLAQRLGGAGRVVALDLLPEVMAPIRRSAHHPAAAGAHVRPSGTGDDQPERPAARTQGHGRVLLRHRHRGVT